ncbi:MAG TPA: hypothetical protein VIV60_28155 [Polyangiaceae bacterium]
MAEAETPTIERVKSPFARGESDRSRVPGTNSTKLEGAVYAGTTAGSEESGSTRNLPPSSAVGVEPPRSRPRVQHLRVRTVHRLDGLRPMTGHEEQLIEEQTRYGNSAALCNALLARCLCRPGDEPGTNAERVNELLVAERDAALVKLRRITFGDKVDSEANCPRCRALVAMSFDLKELELQAREVPEAIELVMWDGRIAELRLPTARDQADLLAVDLSTDAERRTWLLARSLQKLGGVSGPFAVELVHGFDSRTRTELEFELNRVIPDLDLNASAKCQDCGHEFAAPFDVSSFFLPS